MKLAILLPVYKSIEAEAFISLINLMTKELKNVKYHIFVHAYDIIDKARNELVKQAINAECTHILFIDSDQKISEGTFTRLFKVMQDKNAKIVSALIFTKKFPYLPQPRKLKYNYLDIIYDYPIDEIIEVDGIGMGCVLIDTSVFNEIGFPYFKFDWAERSGEPFQVSEDLFFCNKVREKGIKILVDTGITSEHIGSIVSERDYLISKNTIVNLEKERNDMIKLLAEYDKITEQEAFDNCLVGTIRFKDEWNKINPKTKEEREKTYKESFWKKYDLVNWHLGIRFGFDLNLIEYIKDNFPKDASILDYGCGIGFNSYLLRKEGYKNITLFDLDTSFAEFLFKKKGYNLVPFKEKKYDIILCFDVLEHLEEDFTETINHLKKLKKDKIFITASFGNNGFHPMHFDGTDEKKKMIEELNGTGI